MGAYGWSNSWPFEWGGGSTEVEKVYTALKNAVGKGGSAEEGGIDALWRASRAVMIAGLGTFAERAALQAIPNVATDGLAYYRSLFRLPEGATEEEDRADVSARYTAEVDASVPELNALLAAIDSRLSVFEAAHEVVDATVHGRWFEEHGTGDLWGGGRVASDFPNYSHEFILHILFDLGGALPTSVENTILARALAVLDIALPAWVDMAVFTASGFFLDLSPLDLTAL